MTSSRQVDPSKCIVTNVEKPRRVRAAAPGRMPDLAFPTTAGMSYSKTGMSYSKKGTRVRNFEFAHTRKMIVDAGTKAIYEIPNGIYGAVLRGRATRELIHKKRGLSDVSSNFKNR